MIDDVAAVDVSHDRGGHADAHPAQLPFLEIGIDINLAERDDAHDRATLRHPLSNLHLTACHHTIDRRTDDRAAKVEPRIFQLCLGGEDGGVRFDRRATD